MAFGLKARLVLTPEDADFNGQCLEFFYIRTGNDVGELQVKMRHFEESYEWSLWKLSGNSVPASWNYGRVIKISIY